MKTKKLHFNSYFEPLLHDKIKKINNFTGIKDSNIIEGLAKMAIFIFEKDEFNDLVLEFYNKQEIQKIKEALK